MKHQQEQALLAAFRRMNEDEREFMVEFAQMHIESRKNQRPALHLVANTPRAPMNR
ncbi:hypothetical protein [Herbaspirillum sp. ST 5-3]|uniref:hypothetical protein n=1 Tax=Oxalobacteraceae TaxID=75682 RepID=UPI001455E7E9|nr:hypothetical protein [Herbaspirillum sp. ST 5-3]